jgi:hypothetical protein
MMIAYFRCLAASRLFPLVLACVLAAHLAPTRANDSSAAMAAGGLELVKNDRVRMVSEVLRIAPRLVEVNYVFENTGSTDVTTEVAFPLPELDEEYDNPLNIPFPNDANFVGFQVWTDGREIRPAAEVRAFLKGEEITAELKRLGIDPIRAPIDTPGAIPSSVLETLRRRGAIADGFALWITKVSFHWSQTFPAGKQVAVRHRYRPAYGSFYAFPATPESSRGTLDPSDAEWCPDKNFSAAEERLFRRQREVAAKENDKDHQSVSYENVQYVLKTGANWHGPIGRFELQIDKGGADLISTCPIPGLRLQRAPYGFNAVASDYTPTSDLDILFVSSHWLGRPDGSETEKK